MDISHRFQITSDHGVRPTAVRWLRVIGEKRMVFVAYDLGEGKRGVLVHEEHKAGEGRKFTLAKKFRFRA